MSQREPLLSEESNTSSVKSFVSENWYVDSFEAASVGLTKTSFLSALSGLFVRPCIPGGSADFEMGRDTGGGIYRSVLSVDKLKTHPDGSNAETMGELFKESCARYGNQKCMGKRSVLSMRTVGGGFEKYVLGGYEWKTYSEVSEIAQNFGRGVTALGAGYGHKVKFFAETKMEWQIAAKGCFQYGQTISTSYANLGADALVYAINQTQVEILLTDANLVKMIASIADQCPTLKHIIFTEDHRPASHESYLSYEKLSQLLNGTAIELHTFDAVCKLGADNKEKIQPPEVKADDIAVIMYTSGSTGNPKGVMISHRNMIAALSGVCEQIPNMGPGDFYVAYLPLAHILELIAESGILANGAAIGYGTTKTITDASVCIDEGKCRGDAPELRPTLMAAVPAIMDKIRNGVNAKVDAAGGLKAKLFHAAYSSKEAALKNGLDAPFWNRLVFDPLRTRLLGGRLRFMLSGGGPLSKETQDFMNVVFCCPVGQGYGLTETTGSATIVWPNDRTAGRTGAPITCCQLKLEDWEDGSYFVDPSKNSDKSITNPRGEVLIGGDHVSMGYYKNEEKTKESYVEADGTRWFRTGDIGEICEDGVLKLIDRKKDLVKLSGGEYVSYGKLEPFIRDSKLVENAMVYADPNKSFCIALITKPPGKEDLSEQEVYDDIVKILKKNKVAKFEIPKRIKVVDEQWNPENDLATAALKLKRNNLRKHYQELLDSLYN